MCVEWEKETYSKLANLGIINAQNLIIFGGTETKSRNQVNDEKNDAAAEKGVFKTRDGVSKLVSELDVVMVNPATTNFGRAIEVGYIVTVENRLVVFVSNTDKVNGYYAAKSPVRRFPTIPPIP